jgi:hypothetical protein
MRAAVPAGVLYFAIVFAVGFALGTLRVTQVAPVLGEVGATVLEVPLMLVASWLACAWLVGSFRVPRTGAARLRMGGIAFVLLIAAEFLLGVAVFGRTVPQLVAAWSTPSGLIGLAAQAVFALIPFAHAQWVLRR